MTLSKWWKGFWFVGILAWTRWMPTESRRTKGRV